MPLLCFWCASNVYRAPYLFLLLLRQPALDVIGIAAKLFKLTSIAIPHAFEGIESASTQEMLVWIPPLQRGCGGVPYRASILIFNSFIAGI